MLQSELARRVEDIVRTEIAAMGETYEKLVVSIDETAEEDRVVIRLRGEDEDIEIVSPEAAESGDALEAQVHRKLKARLTGSDPFAAPVE